jgi:hypothetical protein
MRDTVIFAIILLILAGYYFYKNGLSSNSTSNQTAPSGLKGSAGLDYIRKNYASGLAQAQSLCTGQFKGRWVDSSTSIGCYDMQGFNTEYCSTDVIQNLVKSCNSIAGNPVCSSTEASCSV